MGGFIDIDVHSTIDLERLSKKFGELAVVLIDVGTEAAGKYLLGVFHKDIAPYKYVSRKQAYGVTWFSDKQRRAVMAKLRSGEIRVPYIRTGSLENGWEMIGGGRNLLLQNNSKSATWTIAETQSRHEMLVGWRKASSTIDSHYPQITDAAARAIQKEINRVMGS